LILQNKWNDWIITTAFYADLHYVEYKLFPLKIKDDTFTSIDDYCDRTGRKNKHETRKYLVHEHSRKISPAFRRLFNTSITARYQNYRIKDEVCMEAKKKLDIVKQFCDHDK
jgi:hypothetical protein